jgi:hypothetical protein
MIVNLFASHKQKKEVSMVVDTMNMGNWGLDTLPKTNKEMKDHLFPFQV